MKYIKFVLLLTPDAYLYLKSKYLEFVHPTRSLLPSLLHTLLFLSTLPYKNQRVDGCESSSWERWSPLLKDQPMRGLLPLSWLRLESFKQRFWQHLCLIHHDIRFAAFIRFSVVPGFCSGPDLLQEFFPRNVLFILCFVFMFISFIYSSSQSMFGLLWHFVGVDYEHNYF